MHSSVAFCRSLCSDSSGQPMAERDGSGVRECPASQGAAAPLVVATRADDRRGRARSGLAPQPWCWACSTARSPTGTDACELRDAAGCLEGAGCRRVGGLGLFGSWVTWCQSLALPSQAGATADGVDSSSLRFLTAAALRKLKERKW